MKALSLWQPWASLIAIHAKRIETRSWATKYRGPLAVHAAKKWDRELAGILATDNRFAAPLLAGGLQELPLGVIIATCRLVDVIEITAEPHTYEHKRSWYGGGVKLTTIPPDEPERSFGLYTPGRFAWLLDDVVRLRTPIPFRARQRLFDVPDELLSGGQDAHP